VRVAASFRDPSGVVFTRAGTLYRQINPVFAAEFEACTASGLYEALASERMLVRHRAASPSLALSAHAHAVIEPAPVPFVSYPYEWCFGELRDAALLTLDLQAAALRRGFILRDASAYNVQFVDGRPLFIDTLSFERYCEGEPWAAYRQFCEHFLLPLALMAGRGGDARWGSALRVHLNGIPLEMGSRLLPRRSWFDVHLLLHVHLHARAQRKYANAGNERPPARPLKKSALLTLVASLRQVVEGLTRQPRGTEWADYAQATNYSVAATAAKREIVGSYLRQLRPAMVWDLGANTGVYSRVARDAGAAVIAFDVDAGAVEKNYRAVRASGESGILPLVLDLTNPSPALGWAHRERSSLVERGPADVVMALALIHHLAISNNVPLEHIAEFFASLGRAAIVEFVPKSDSQVQRLLRSRADIFPRYTRQGFERAFRRHFRIDECQRAGDAERWLYRMTALGTGRRRHLP